MSLLQKFKPWLQRNTHLKIQDLERSLKLSGLERNKLKGSRILIYHGVDEAHNMNYNSRFLGQKKLFEQLKFFKTYANIISLSDLLTGNYDEQTYNIVLTFDDGYWNNLNYVLPVLEELQVSASFCVTGIADTSLPILWPDYLDIAAIESRLPLQINGIKYVSKKKLPWQNFDYYSPEGVNLKQIAKQGDSNFIAELLEQLQNNLPLEEMMPFETYWQQMNKKEIQKLADSPLTQIISHGYSHNSLGQIPYPEACEEMVKSKVFLENLIQQPIDTIAYPFGSYTEDLVDFGQSIGFQYHLAVGYLDKAHIDHSAIWDRLTINPYISSYNQFLAILKGKYYGQL